MNFGSDHQVRNAFRATLLDEPSSASLGTQEIDAADVLEVTDLAHAIAKAEEVIRARSSRVLMTGPDSSAGHVWKQRSADGEEDIFDKLVATDDAVGPAVHVSSLPTPLPPRAAPIPLPPGIMRPATLLRAPDTTIMTPLPTLGPPLPTSAAPLPTSAAPIPTSAAPIPTPAAPAPMSAGATQPLAAIVVPPAPRTAPILVLDEDAFYHPAGRIRSLAEVTLDGYRPEPTLMVRLRQRRHTLSRVFLVVLAPLTLLALFAIAVGVGRASAEHESEPATAKPATTTTAAPALPAPEPTVKAAAPATTAPASPVLPAPPEPTVKAAAPTTTAAPVSEIPVFDVNSLKNAPPAKRRR